MPKSIVWSDNSKVDISNLVLYLKLEWGKEIADDYITLIDELIQQFAIFPKMYPMIHKRKKIRKCVVSKHNTIYYREKRDFIEIVNVFDTRQNPEKLKFK